jgi:hypothetical protein
VDPDSFIGWGILLRIIQFFDLILFWMVCLAPDLFHNQNLECIQKKEMQERIQPKWKNQLMIFFDFFVLFGKEFTKRIKWFILRIPHQQENQGQPWFSQESNCVMWLWPRQVTMCDAHLSANVNLHDELDAHDLVMLMRSRSLADMPPHTLHSCVYTETSVFLLLCLYSIFATKKYMFSFYSILMLPYFSV